MTRDTGRIVVGLDGSAGGRAALAFALDDAARRHATVDVITSFDTAETLAALTGTSVGSAGTSTAEMQAAVEREAADTVEEVSAELTRKWDRRPAVTVTAVGGSATHALLRAAQGADLLVVGSRGRGKFMSTVFGSVGMQCVLHAPCTVSVVHAAPAPEAAPAPA